MGRKIKNYLKELKQDFKSLTRKEKAEHIIAIFLMITLLASVVYSLVRFILAPTENAPGEEYVKVKSDYLLMLTQCLLGVIVMLIPSFFSRKLKIALPSTMVIMYYIFLYCAIYLGEIHNFYYVIPHWDLILHAFSGAMLGAFGFLVVDLLNKDELAKVNLSPVFESLFAFVFALAVGVLWEIYEFSFDAILGLNMQKFKTEDGIPLVGAAALSDTMEDLIIDGIAALAVAVIGLISNLKKKKAAVNESSENKCTEASRPSGAESAENLSITIEESSDSSDIKCLK